MASPSARRKSLKKRLQRLSYMLSSVSMHCSMLRDDVGGEIEDFDLKASGRKRKLATPSWYNRFYDFVDSIDPVIGHLEDAEEILNKEVKL